MLGSWVLVNLASIEGPRSSNPLCNELGLDGRLMIRVLHDIALKSEEI